MVHFIISLTVFLILGVWAAIKGLSDETAYENSTKRSIAVVVFIISLACFFMSLAPIFPDFKDSADSWEKKKYPVVHNPGDDGYYMDLGSRYYYLSDWDSNNVAMLHNDSVVTYQPGRGVWYWGALYSPGTSNLPSEWIIRYQDDLIYERYVETSKQVVELKEEQ